LNFVLLYKMVCPYHCIVVFLWEGNLAKTRGI
jgi:hypothetical protein